MAFTGTYTYLATANDIMTDALENIGVYAAGETIAPLDVEMSLRALNMLCKQWMGQADFAAGLKMWSRRDGYLFLQQSRAEYLLGPTGDHATLDYVSTTLTAASPISDTTLTVSSIAGISSGDAVGVVLDDGSIHWDVANGAPVGATVTITTGLASAAASGNRVFAYTSKIARPLDILFASLRNVSGKDTRIDPLTLDQYESMADKSSVSTPTMFYFENQLTNSKLYLDCYPSDVNEVLRLKLLYPVDDYADGTDDVAYPQQWYAALSWGLAKRIAPKFGKVWRPDLEANYQEALAMARSVNPDVSRLYFMPGLE